VFLAVPFARGNVENSALSACFMKYFVLSVMFAAGCILSVNRKLTPKNTGIMASSYFFVCLIYQIAACLLNGQSFNIGFSLLRAVILYGLIMAVLLRFYFSRQRTSPVPVYLFSLIWIVLEVRNYFFQVSLYLYKFNSDFGFAAATVGLFSSLLIAFLLACQVYILQKEKKRSKYIKNVKCFCLQVLKNLIKLN